MSKTSLFALVCLGAFIFTNAAIAKLASCDNLAGNRDGIWSVKDPGDPYTCRYKAQSVTTTDGSNTSIEISFSDPNHPVLCDASGTLTLTGTCSNGELSLNGGFTGQLNEYLLEIDGPNDNPHGYFINESTHK